MARLDGRARLQGAIENTHQPDYITEKFFDAFACGAVPLYYASPGHRIHDLGLPPESWLNLYGLTPAVAAERLRGWLEGRFAPGFSADTFAAAQARLNRLFCDRSAWGNERARLARALPRVLAEVLDDRK